MLDASDRHILAQMAVLLGGIAVGVPLLALVLGAAVRVGLWAAGGGC